MRYLYTVGHSTHPLGFFLELLKKHSITAICDVRSVPYSQHNPQFNREILQTALVEHGIAYVFLGRELGARSDNPDCYVDDRVQYSLLAKEPLCLQGLERVKKGMGDYRIALMCSGKDPLMCHRTIHVCRNMRARDVEIRHILADGGIEIEQEHRSAVKRHSLASIQPSPGTQRTGLPALRSMRSAACSSGRPRAHSSKPISATSSLSECGFSSDRRSSSRRRRSIWGKTQTAA